MSKFTIKANELSEPDVNIVALVKRGANRVPFRITKSEDEMGIDLHRATRELFAKADRTPKIAAVVVAKSADLAALTPVLAGAGIDLSKMTKTEGDDAITFEIDNGTALLKEDSQAKLVKLDDQVTLAVTGIMKSFDGWDFESTSFKEIMSKGAFIPSLCVAQDMLSRTMYNIMEKADNPKAAAAAIKSAAADFGDYIVGMAKGLPESAFKADVALRKAAKGKAAEDMKDGGADDASENADGSKKKAKKVDGDGSGVAAATPQESAKATAEDNNSDNNAKKKPNETVPAVAVKKNEGDAAATTDAARKLPDGQSGAGAQQADPSTEQVIKTDGMAALMEQMKQMLSGTTDEIKKHVAGEVQKMDTRLTAALKKTDDALAGTVLGSDDGDDRRTGVQKTDDTAENVPPLLDSALMSRDFFEKSFPSEKRVEYNGRRHH
jgi:hypothetical protein